MYEHAPSFLFWHGVRQVCTNRFWASLCRHILHESEEEEFASMKKAAAKDRATSQKQLVMCVAGEVSPALGGLGRLLPGATPSAAHGVLCTQCFLVTSSLIALPITPHHTGSDPVQPVPVRPQVCLREDRGKPGCGHQGKGTTPAMASM